MIYKKFYSTLINYRINSVLKHNGYNNHIPIFFHTEKKILPSSIQISEELLNEAKKVGATNARSLSDQIEWWARMSKCVEDNPDLTYSQIKEILMGKEELDRGEKTEYTFG